MVPNTHELKQLTQHCSTEQWKRHRIFIQFTMERNDMDQTSRFLIEEEILSRLSRCEALLRVYSVSSKPLFPIEITID